MGGASLGSALISSNAMGKASGDQADATRRAIALQGAQYDTTRSDQAPYRELGSSAVARLRNFFGMPAGAASFDDDPRYKEIYQGSYDYIDNLHRQQFGMPMSAGTDPAGKAAQMQEIERNARAEFNRKYPDAGQQAQAGQDFGGANKKFTLDDFWQDPVTQASYQAGLEQGTKALRNAAPLTTGIDSGAAMKELTKFGTDYTGMKAGESQARFEGNKSNVFNRLMAMIGGGQVSNQVTAGAGGNAANNTAGLVTAQGNANAASQIGQANAWGGALGSLSNWWSQQNTLDRLFPKKTQAPTDNFAWM